MEKLDLRLHRGPAALLGALGNADARVVEVHGDGAWHCHASAEELAVVVSGRMDIEFRDAAKVALEAGQALLIPRGVEHRARAIEPCALLLVRERDPA